ncbi:MAG: nitrilase-related carbon-nitrogen hydrolase, partial [Candidatus Thorarchaeota archaeon]
MTSLVTYFHPELKDMMSVPRDSRHFVCLVNAFLCVGRIGRSMIHVAAVQIAPVYLRAEETWNKLETYIREAHSNGAELVTWGETLIPGYPFWISPSGGAR